MKAPDIIFLSSPDGDFNVATWDTISFDNDVCVEYIRKDALLEWAQEKNKRIDTEEGDYTLGYVSAMIDLIEKIESL